MTAAEIQSLRDRGYTAAEAAELAGLTRAQVDKMSTTAGRMMSSISRRTWEWLCEQYEPVRPADLAEALALTVGAAARRLRRLRERGLAVNVGDDLWVALDLPEGL